MGKYAVLSTELKRLMPLVRQGAGSAVFSLRWGEPEISAHALQYSIDRIFDSINQGRAEPFCCINGGSVESLIVWEPLEWDSRILGFRCGKVLAFAGINLEGLLSAWKKRVRGIGLDYITCRVTSGFDSLASAGFQKLEDIIYLSGRTQNRSRVPSVRSAVSSDMEAAAEIASKAYRHDRFHSEDIISSSAADAIHREWALSCFKGRADGIFVAQAEGRVRGFCAAILPEEGTGQPGWIDMLAVSPESRRGRIGEGLVLASLRFFSEKGVERAALCTQSDNLPALQLYGKLGFEPCSKAASYRLIP